jgi:DNA-binding CsgD family transcriptional regulator
MIVYLREKKRLALYFSGFAFSFTLFCCAELIKLYHLSTGLAELPVYTVFPAVLFMASALLCIAAAPRFVMSLLQIRINRLVMLILFLIIIAGLVIMISFISRGLYRRSTLISSACSIAAISSSICIVVLFARKRMKEIEFSGALQTYLWITAVSLPFIIIDLLNSAIPFLSFLSSQTFLFYPVYIIIMGIAALTMIGHYITYTIRAGRLDPEHIFFHNFAINERDRKIIILLFRGNSYEEIAESLFVSPVTVKNAIGKIHERTETKNKLELYRKIQETKEGGAGIS